MNLIIAIPLDESLAAFVGKKGSANSITFYNRKMGGDVIVALFPSQEEDKTYALAESLLLASQTLLSTSSVDKRFGEALVAASLLGRRILLTQDTDVGNMLENSGITNCRAVPREELLNALSNASAEGKAEQGARVDIDKAFPVRGIGTVVLGIVTKGSIKQHDKLFHTSGKEVTVRSIQSQDEDVRVAGTGTRVGISLKDIGEGEISRGDLLTSRHVGRHERIAVEWRMGSIAKESVVEGASYGIAANFSYCECIVKKAEAGSVELALRAKLPVEVGDEVLLVRKEVPRIFAAGRITATLD